ncbi:MAG: hypothetical protein KGY99_11300 [Phycisphaerae bacterium]|nr:hypothetical protein [Phycisphaerae bacterium]
MTNAKRYDAKTPDDPTSEDVLYDALRENLSPQAVAAIAAYLQPIATMDPDVVRQVMWLRRLLTATVGGNDSMDRLCDEAGL